MTRREFLAATLAARKPAAPNIVILLADDLGWADVGFHGSEIRTPNLDRLAAEGMQLDRFYSYPLCSPTRSALMTGRSPMRFGVVYATIEPFDDYGVPTSEHFLPETLKAAGYETAMCGKWHLGHRHVKYLPNSRGFDHSYGVTTQVARSQNSGVRMRTPATRFVLAAYRLSRTLPRSETYGLSSQFQRAAVSICWRPIRRPF